MSAKSANHWDVQFRYRTAAGPVWRRIATLNGNERQANKRAMRMYEGDPRALDLLVVPAERRP